MAGFFERTGSEALCEANAFGLPLFIYTHMYQPAMGERGTGEWGRGKQTDKVENEDCAALAQQLLQQQSFYIICSWLHVGEGEIIISSQVAGEV